MVSAFERLDVAEWDQTHPDNDTSARQSQGLPDSLCTLLFVLPPAFTPILLPIFFVVASACTLVACCYFLHPSCG